ncbi:L,D-transpeptidase [Pseudonocardia sp. MH-G8]|uniref:L,D-transpeptidase n=1 Tax=Pseudonocardia sp. MH-G8 TaxID=1854588 RepID=UPI000BA0EFA1|nr:L,D-transpeptidase [Pseudonocardia sp. MH-G8]OZM76405.1 L,D-transpeptidase [Pseudonocardia sp. MH-G8]
MGTHGGRFGPGSGRKRRVGLVLATTVAAVVSGGSFAGADEVRTPVPESRVEGTPCTAEARACVDLPGLNAWLLRDGEIVRGPVKISTGGEGKATPPGNFQVEWKNKEHVSAEYDSPMPYAVFFAPGGIAFHEGNLKSTSAGCVRLAQEDAAAFYDYLQVGDPVEVHSEVPDS